MHAADQANQQMVDALIAEGCLWSPALIAAFRATPRHRFLDRVFQYQGKANRWREIITRDPEPADIALLYSDQALITRLGGDRRLTPISSSSQPSLMAQMLEDLRLQSGQKVLEIGAGTGYNAALMAFVVGPDRVTSIDVDMHVLSEAWDHIRRFPDRRVCLKHADGRLGHAEAAPYDRILATASTPDLEPAWLGQLRPDGLLSAPLNLAPGVSYVVCGTVRDGIFTGRLVRPAYFMPLRHESEAGGDDEADKSLAATSSQAIAAPWANLFERRRPRVGWARFIHSITFYAWLRGLEVRQRRSADQQLLYGIQQPAGPCCWLGAQEWYIDGDEARQMGLDVWRAFLDAGGPWPTEFRLRAAPHGQLTPQAHREVYVKQGPRCQQLWELIEPRDRPAWL